MIRLNGVYCRAFLSSSYDVPLLVEVPSEDLKDIVEYPTYFKFGNLPIIYPKLFFSLVNKGLNCRVDPGIGAGGFNYSSHMGVI